MTRRTPDLVVLCSRRPNTVTARVFGGVLVVTSGVPEPVDLRSAPPIEPGGYIRRVTCRCGTEHHWWSVAVLRERRGKVTSAEVERPWIDGNT